MRVAFALPVMDENGPATVRISGLQLRLTVASQMFAFEFGSRIRGDPLHLRNERIRVFVVNVLAKAKGRFVDLVLAPHEICETRISIQSVGSHVGRCISLPPPTPNGAAVACVGHHGVKHVKAGLDEETLFQFRVLGDEVVFRVIGIGSQDFRQFVHAARPNQPVASAFLAHAVAVQALDQNPRHGVFRPTLVPRKRRSEEPIEPLFGHAGSIQGDSIHGQARVGHARVPGNPAILARFQSLQQQVILDVPANGLDAALVAELVFLRLVRAECDKLCVILDPVEDQVIAACEPLGDTRLPDAAFDTSKAGSALAMLKASLVQRQIVHLRIDIGDPVQQHGRLMGKTLFVGQCVGLRQRVQTGANSPPHRALTIVGDHIMPFTISVEHSVPVVDVQLV